ncbi:FAD-dependent oxidoreductase [Roseobacter ponti]|uniref:FAD-dependent oxidoreductase n=1 Tax=Roseobacter ponti TaxID=1891787 RepID=A0A858SV45_9RHOB|nr:FAD-dependent oxidoreductase [Roseobacter ponti]QJF51877.1 FAD-dependent oxidoreductase [Roseobacter ponti]
MSRETARTDDAQEPAFRLYSYEKRSTPGAGPEHHPVVVVGAGPVGLATALDLARRGTPVLVLDAGTGPGQGSRAICFSQRTLQIAQRLGAGDAMLKKGVVWNTGRVFHGPDRIFKFNLQPEEGHRHPAFINLQQPYFEKFLVEAIRRAQKEGAPVEIRGGNRVTGISVQKDGVSLGVDTPDGAYDLRADWCLACDGARSALREMTGQSFEGRVFEDNFLIADVRMKADFPTERWFWFEPPFKDAGQSALLHKQPDDIWRIDFQLGRDIDRDAELDPARVRARVDAMLGEGAEYELVWTSVYRFQCRRMHTFRQGRVLFAGDAAHQVSPFGARGANSGVQDAENLAWKLDLVVRGQAPENLLDSYCAEREHGADENILNSTRSTDFLTPKTRMSRVFRDAVLELARAHSFARPLVNSGRLSVPCVYDGLALNGSDALNGPARTRPGAPCPDAPLREGFLLDRLSVGFTLLAINTPPPDPGDGAGVDVGTLVLNTQTDDPSGALRTRYLGEAEQAIYLIRPDQHVTARWPAVQTADIAAALRRATGREK